MHTGRVKRSSASYDPRVRPWYRPVAESHTARWTPLYAGSTNPLDVGISATYPLFSEDVDGSGRRRFLGVLGSDISLSSLNGVLASAPLATTFQSDVSYIVEMGGHLVAQSDGGTLAKPVKGNASSSLLMASESANPLVAQSAAILGPNHNEEATHRLRVQGRDYVVQVAPFVDPKGIDWRLVSVVAKDELTRASTREANLALMVAAVLAVLGLYLALAIVQTVVKPIEQTAQAAKGLALADKDELVLERLAPPIHSRVAEVSLLVESFRGMAQRIAEQMQHLKHLALRDSVTNLLHARGIADAARWPGKRRAMVVKLGVGNYAVVTALMPPRFADELARVLATRLSAASRQAFLIARADGGEFVFLFVDLAPAQCDAALASLQEAFVAPFVVGEDEISLHAALGVSRAECKAAEVSTRLLPEASLALASVGQRIGHPDQPLVVFDDSLYHQAAVAARAEVELRNAVAAQEFVVYFQPIVDLQTEAIVGVESLVRWPHSKRGMVPPSEFIPLAEESGLIIVLGDWILRKACEEVAGLQRLVTLPPSFFVNVNVSVRQLLQSDFVGVVGAALAASGLAASQLKIEITESLLLQENASTLETIAALQKLGVRFALDDFGTGYSSLSYLPLSFPCHQGGP